MDALDLIIKESLKNSLKLQGNQKKSALTERAKHANKQFDALKFLYEFHLKHIGPIHPVERLALKEQLVRVKQKTLITEQIALPRDTSNTITPRSFADTLNPPASTINVPTIGVPTIPGFTDVNKLASFIQNSQKIKDRLQYQPILNHYNQQDFEQAWKTAGKTGVGKLTNDAFKGRQLKRWKNAAADSFFHGIIAQDPNFNSNKTGNTIFSGFSGDVRNADDQIYNYSITVRDDSGKSICIMTFYPNGDVGVTPDLAPVMFQQGKSMLTWKLNGDKVEIYSSTEEKLPALFCKPDQYILVAKVNPQIANNEYDAYKGEIFSLRAAFLSLKGYQEQLETQYASQEEYDESNDSMLDTVQSIADWAGLIPGFGDIIDLVNGLVYWLRGKRFEACLSWIAVIPMVGSIISKGLRGFFNSLKFGGKNGIQILNAFLRSGGGLTGLFKGLMQGVVDAAKKNKETRKNLITWFKELKGIGDFVMKTIRGIRDWCKGRFGFNWIADVMTTMEAKLGDLPKLLGDTTNKMENLVANLDTANAVIVTAKEAAEETATKLSKGIAIGGKNKAVKEALMKLAGKAPKLALNSGFMNRFFYRILGPKWWDAYTRSITYSFIKYAKSNASKFVGAICMTPGGRDIVAKQLRSMKILNPEIISNLVRIDTNVARLVSNIPSAEKQAYVIINYFKELPDEGLELFFQNLKSAFAAGADGALSSIGAKTYDALANNIIIDCVKEGNALFRMFCESTWASLRAAAPGRIAQFTEAAGFSILKYDFTGGYNPLRGLSEPLSKWLSEATAKWGAAGFIPQLLNLLQKTFVELFNFKRLDVYYNELRDYFEKLNIDDNNIDEVNGFTAGAIGSIAQWGFEMILPESVVKNAKSFIKSIAKQDKTVDPERYGVVNAPQDIDFVKSGEFATKVKDYKPAPAKTPAQRAADSTAAERFKTY